MSQNFSIPEDCAALVLAAGRGTRMHTPIPKVLLRLLDEPLLAHVLHALKPLFPGKIWIVTGHCAEQVRKTFADDASLHYIDQAEQLGTGHALMQAMPALRAAGIRHALIVNGDTPLISSAMLSRFLRDAEGTDLAVATLTVASPGAYGRIVRHQDRITAIVEAKDYDPKLHGPESNEINAGIYFCNLQAIEPLLPLLTCKNHSGEYYITDLVHLAVEERMLVTGLSCGRDSNLLGINTPAELLRSEEILRHRMIRLCLKSGVILHAPESIRIGAFARIDPGAEIYGPCEIYGLSYIASGAVIEAFCHIRNTRIAAGTVIHGFCHLEDADIASGCLVGPYARLRPGACMESESHVGNFVEMKKARLGQGAKANHLTYLGDAQIGAGTNIGAGTITCNYDGINKHHTEIGNNVFIGSNTSLVAPVTIGDNAAVGAGSVITRNLPEHTLGVTRSRQKTLPLRKK